MFENFDNVFTYAAANERYFERIAGETGYKRISTFYSDLSIAEWYGKDSIQETFDNVCKSWISDYKMFTEFILSLNYKAWQWAEDNPEFSKLYSELFYEARDLAYDKFTQEGKDYLYETTD